MKTTVDLPPDLRMQIMVYLMERGRTRGLSEFIVEAAREKLARENKNVDKAKPTV